MTINDLWDILESSQLEYIKTITKSLMKDTSQYFTPKFVVYKMLDTIDLELLLDKKEVRILEPSAGCGALILGAIDYLIKNTKITSITIDAYELDSNVCKYLNSNIIIIKNYAKLHKVKLSVNIINSDFLVAESTRKYNLILSNPPFKKINKKDYIKHSLFKKILYGQPNKYLLFIAKSLTMLCNESTYCLISPKNYLTGVYSKKLREFILSGYNLTHLHTFDCKHLFKSVDQEIILSTFVKSQKTYTVTISHNGTFVFKKDIKKIFYDKNMYSIIVPKNNADLQVLNKFYKLKTTLSDLKIKISVGPVVQFRNKEYLSTKPISEPQIIPLLIAKDIKSDNRIIYKQRISKNHIKPFSMNDKCKHLVPNQRYILLQKVVYTAKGSIIVPAILEPEYFINKKFIGIDNNLLYIHSVNSDSIPINLCYGLFCLFNSEEFNRLMLIINGTHAINISDFNNIKFPDVKILETLGRDLLKSKDFRSKNCSIILNKHL